MGAAVIFVPWNIKISPFIPERTLKSRFAVLEDGKIPEHAALPFRKWNMSPIYGYPTCPRDKTDPVGIVSFQFVLTAKLAFCTPTPGWLYFKVDVCP